MIRILSLALAALSSDRPAVLIPEDVHWLDAASREILTEVLRGVARTRLLVLARLERTGAEPGAIARVQVKLAKMLEWRGRSEEAQAFSVYAGREQE